MNNNTSSQEIQPRCDYESCPANLVSNDEYRWIAASTITFKSIDFSNHACAEPNCGDLFPRLRYRLNKHNERKTHSLFSGDAYDNDDHIEDNKELI